MLIAEYRTPTSCFLVLRIVRRDKKHYMFGKKIVISEINLTFNEFLRLCMYEHILLILIILINLINNLNYLNYKTCATYLLILKSIL